MSCSITSPIITFLKSSRSFEIKDLSTRSSRSRYNMAKIKVSKEDAGVIAQNALHMEPVTVSFDGTIQNRYIYNTDSLEIHRDSGWLKLYDAQKILDRGVLTNHFVEVTVGDVMDYIIERKDDPHGAITGWKAVTPELVEQERQSSEEDIVELVNGSDADADTSGLGRAINSALGSISRFVGFMGKSNGMPYNEFRGLDLEDVTPNGAIKMLENMFGFASWVDNQGVLWIGQPEAIPNERHVVSGKPEDKAYAMKDYNVIEGAFPITLVRLNGETHFNSLEGELFPIAEAAIIDPVTGERAEGAKYSPDDSRSIWELEALEDAATQVLLQDAFSHKNGTIVFNGAASTEKEKLAKIGIGDIIMVGNAVSEHCNKQVDGGSWVVSEVQHKVSPERGWKVTCKVGSVPPEIETTSLYYDPANDDAYRDLESYGGDY